MKTVVLGNGIMGSELSIGGSWCCLSHEKHAIDILDLQTIEPHIKRCSTVINCIGYTDTYCEHKEPSWSVNFIGVMGLVDLCNKYNSKLIHISTDYIYANSIPYAKECDVPIHFDNWYTYSKLLADAYIQARCMDYLIVRCSYKPRPFPWDKAWDNLTGNFDYVDIIGAIIRKLIYSNANGVFNVGTEVKTMHELAIKTKPDCQHEQSDRPPYNITMNLDKLYGWI